MARRLPLFPLLAALLLGAAPLPASAQTSLGELLSPAARQQIGKFRAQKEVRQAIHRLERSPLPRPMLGELLASQRAAEFMPTALPRLADLAEVAGIQDVMKRMIRGGRSGAYELAVAHAFRGEIKAASSFVGGNEVDGLLRSGTVIEAKSGRPKRPDHVLDQVRKRAAGGNSVVLALNYLPPKEDMVKLKRLGKELGGRLQVTYLPLAGSGYQVLVPGKKLIAPTTRTARVYDNPIKAAAGDKLAGSAKKPAQKTVRAQRTAKIRAKKTARTTRPARRRVTRSRVRRSARQKPPVRLGGSSRSRR